MKNIFKKIIVFILIWEAKLVLKKYDPKIVAVTGSVGKTSTKDAIYTALLPFFHVRKSSKSFNSDIGIPLTILGVPNGWNDPKIWIKNIFHGLVLLVSKKEYPKWLVLEIGADRPGEIESISKWIRPDVAVITRIGKVPVHVEFYKSVADVVKEKSFLARAVKKGGTLIVNADDEDVAKFREYTNARGISFGLEEQADVRGSYPQVIYDERKKPSGMSVKIDIAGSSIPVSISGVLGRHHLYPVLAAFAVAHSQGLNLLSVSESFSSHKAPRGRMNIIEGISGSTIIDDTYNASPVALEEGLNILKEIKTEGRKIVMLGDMLELGKFSVAEHRRLGLLASKNADVIITVGIRAKDYAEGAIEGGYSAENIFSFDNSESAGKYAQTIIKPYDCVYVKGSQGMRMEKAVVMIMANSKIKDKLLVRQEKEWLSR